MTEEPIQGLWVGTKLSAMERISIASFLREGHEYHLYTYGRVDGVPSGATVKDAREILPESMIFQYREHASYAGFANYFRYKLLLDRGGWWVDTDTVCVRPFAFAEPYVFGCEPTNQGGEAATASPIKAPAGSPALAFAWEFCRARTPEILRWGETGPHLVRDMIRRFGLEGYVHAADVFCPIPPSAWRRLVDPKAAWKFGHSTRAVHLWNELWRREAWDKDRDYPPGSLYETWKRDYLSPVSCSDRIDPGIRRKSLVIGPLDDLAGVEQPLDQRPGLHERTRSSVDEDLASGVQ